MSCYFIPVRCFCGWTDNNKNQDAIHNRCHHHRHCWYEYWTESATCDKLYLIFISNVAGKIKIVYKTINLWSDLVPLVRSSIIFSNVSSASLTAFGFGAEPLVNPPVMTFLNLLLTNFVCWWGVFEWSRRNIVDCERSKENHWDTEN